MDRGFELMIPTPTSKEVDSEFLFNHKIQFSIFGREFNLSFNVKQKPE